MSSQEPAEPLSSPPLILPRTLKGSCHCGYMTYTADVELPMHPHLPLASRCNCLICLKTGFTGFALPKGKEAFHLLTPKSLDDEGIVDLASVSKLDNREVHRYFCKGCGVTICAGGHYTIKPAKDARKSEREEMPSSDDRGNTSKTSRPPQEKRDPATTSALSSSASTTTEPPKPQQPIPRMPFSTAARIVTQTTASLRRVREAQQQRASAASTKDESSASTRQTEPAPSSKSEPGSAKPATSSASVPWKEKAAGETVHFFTINLVTIDQPQEGVDLSVWKIEYYDGRNDNWMAGKRSVPWKGGIV